MQSCGQRKKKKLIQEAFDENDDSPMGLQHHPEIYFLFHNLLVNEPTKVVHS